MWRVEPISSCSSQSVRQKQTGFTLLEIAIVLVIIGLILGGVLKGQELVNGAKVKALASDFRDIPLFIFGYQDRYKRLPGDDGHAVARFGAATADGNDNWMIGGAWDSTNLADESVRFWQHVRLANLAAGSTDFSTLANAGLPTNAEGGMIGIQMTAPIAGMSGTYYACTQQIVFRLAQQLDRMLDDGSGATGAIRAQAGSATDSANPGMNYAEGNIYTLCLAI